MTDETDSDIEDVFDDNVSDTVQTILLMRIYDMVTCIARGVNKDEADIIFKGHALGKIFGPAPSFDMLDESDPDTTS